MQSYSAAYLHLMRAFARTGRAETFAFSTSLTRLTPALVHRSAGTALELAEERVVDRYGGTHLAGSLRDLLASRHGSTLRGGVLIIASDGWDSDPPEELRAVMARLARRARRVVWLNPRAGVPGFEPLVGSMAAALPFCDAFLPAHTVAALPDVFAAVAPAAAQLHRVTCTAGRNLPTPAASPRTIAWVARGVATKRISSALAEGCWPSDSAQVAHAPRLTRCGRVDAHEPAVAEVVADGEPDRDRQAHPAPGLGQGRGVALEDALAASRDSDSWRSIPEASPAGPDGPGTQVPGLARQLVERHLAGGHRVLRRRHHDDVVGEERLLHQLARRRACRAGPERDVHRARGEQCVELRDGMHAQLDVEVARAAG